MECYLYLIRAIAPRVQYLILTGFWVIYLTLHSLLAASNSKEWVRRNLKLAGSGYRLVYSLVSTMGILTIGWWMSRQNTIKLFDSLILEVLGGLVLLVGLLIIALSFKYLSGLEFLGLRTTRTEDQLMTSGIHSKVRHPIYSGTILVLAGCFMIRPTDLLLVSLLVILVYLPVGIFFEEKKLISKFGDNYLEYRQRVPPIIPRF